MKLSVLLASCLPLLSVAADGLSLPANIEVDVIFPRNDTYGPAENFPIILAIQNAALAWDFGFYVSWDVRNLTKVSGTNFVDSDTFLINNNPKQAVPADPYFLVNSTSRLTALYSWPYGTYRLSWAFQLTQNCTESRQFINYTFGATVGSGSLIFSIADGAKVANLTDGGACPPTGGVIGIAANITGCPHVDNSGLQPTPCNIVINEALATSLSSQLPANTETRATSKTTATTAPKTTTGVPSSKTNGGVVSTTSTTATGNHAAYEAPLQTAAAMIAGAVGLCALLV